MVIVYCLRREILDFGYCLSVMFVKTCPPTQIIVLENVPAIYEILLAILIPLRMSKHNF